MSRPSPQERAGDALAIAEQFAESAAGQLTGVVDERARGDDYAAEQRLAAAGVLFSAAQAWATIAIAHQGQR